MAYHYRNLVLETSEDVYKPAEDSLLLAGNVVVEGGSVLDIGTGTGIQALNAAKDAEYVVGVDINPAAVELARRNAQANGIGNVKFIVSDLFENVEGRFDTVIFNPPYLPVSEDGSLAKAWSGGHDGVEVIDRFIKQVKGHLNQRGRVFLLASSVNNLDDVLVEFGGECLQARVIAKEKLFFEELCVVSAFLSGGNNV
ncbi:MAG: HemK2/MTQ2 family protein methyltransferase [Candidatus Altiarchaeota archaeon]